MHIQQYHSHLAESRRVNRYRGGSTQRGFVSEWTLAAGSFTYPAYNAGGSINCTINWGDGSAESTVTAYGAPALTHTYASPGTYQIEVRGNMPSFAPEATGLGSSITDIIDWGSPELFGGFNLLYMTSTAIVSLGEGSIGITGASPTLDFSDCASLSDLSNTDVFANGSSLTTMYSMFLDCTSITEVPAGFFDPLTSVTTFQRVFRGCTSLTTIPSELFKYNVAALNFSSAFQECSSLQEIPSDLFKYNTNVTTFASCFYQSGLQEIPSDLFKYNTKVTNFASCFAYCSTVTSIPSNLFRYNTLATNFGSIFRSCSGITEIPTEVFRYNTAATSFAFVFGYCTSVTSIPTDLFRYNTAATTMSQLFEGCTGITSIPTTLFQYNTLATTFESAFIYCSGVTSIPEDLFKYNTVAGHFGATFYECTGITSVPANLFKENTGAYFFQNAFLGCTALETVGANLFKWCTSEHYLYFGGAFDGCTKMQQTTDIFFAAGEQATRFSTQHANFTNCFRRTSFTGTQGTAPALWTCTFHGVTKTGCWNGAGNSLSSLSNYASIPSDWKI